jgi:hypothetical protein
VTFAVGFFDLFTYTFAGTLYVGFFSYLALRLQIVDPAALTRLPVLIAVVVVVIASYFLGYIAYDIGHRVGKLIPRRVMEHPRHEFLRRTPQAADRPFARADVHLLLCALVLHDREVAMEISRRRAAGLMLRSAAPPLLFGAIAAVVEAFVWKHHAAAAVLAVLLLGGFLSLIIEGRKHIRWAALKTLELAFWVPDIDAKLGPPAAEKPVDPGD